MKQFLHTILALFILSGNAQAAKVTITFQVDMRSAKVADKTTVGIRGNTSPLSWKKSFPLTDADNDGIFTGDITFDNGSNNTVEYKYFHDEKWENITGNRSLTLDENAGKKPVIDNWQKVSSAGLFKFAYKGDTLTMAQRMPLGEQVTHGISLCVLRNGAVDTSVQWGFRDVEKKLPVEAKTAFQLGGITQPLVIFSVLRSHEQGLLDLDKPINSYLKRWKLPAKNGGNDDKSTIRDIITGKIAFGDKSKPDGYAAGQALPTVVQILMGSEPSKERGLKITDTKYFSFYAALVLQVLLEDVHQQTLAEVSERLVFAPLSMKHSFFATELTPEQQAVASTGYEKNGKPTRDNYYRYPEQGFSGAWSTTEDYAKFVGYIVKAARGEDNTLLSQTMAKSAVEPASPTARPLMFPRNSDGGNYFGGAPQGFRTQTEFNVEQNWVVVALMNSWENWRFMGQVLGKGQEFATRELSEK
jgi:CubicO group peptidase (beta-lactamase class C family)